MSLQDRNKGFKQDTSAEQMQEVVKQQKQFLNSHTYILKLVGRHLNGRKCKPNNKLTFLSINTFTYTYGKTVSSGTR